MRSLIRLWYRAIAHLCWFDLGLLKAQRRDSAKLIVVLELELAAATRARRRAYLEHDLAAERRYLAGIDEAIRLTGIEATRAAMRAMI